MNFFIKGTKTTPAAIINNGYMKIAGNSTSLAENNVFFDHMNKQIGLYTQHPTNITSVDIALRYINADSKRKIIDLLKTFEELHHQGFQVSINWYFEKDDENVKELGEIFNAMFDVQFNFFATSM